MCEQMTLRELMERYPGQWSVLPAPGNTDGVPTERSTAEMLWSHGASIGLVDIEARLEDGIVYVPFEGEWIPFARLPTAVVNRM